MQQGVVGELDAQRYAGRVEDVAVDERLILVEAVDDERAGDDERAVLRPLPREVVDGTRARYVDAFERLTGVAFDRYVADPTVVL